MNETAMKKAQKVFNLAKNAGTEGEAQAAMLALQRILVEHGIEMSEIEMASQVITEKEKKVDQEVVDEMGQRVHWRGLTASTIAANFRCKTFWSPSRSGRHTLIFLGLAEDVVFAKQTYTICVSLINKLVRKHLDERKKAQGTSLGVSEAQYIRSSFIMGFLSGLKRGFQEQVAKNCYALALVLDPAVKKEIASLRLRRGNRSEATYGMDNKARTAGEAAGHSFGTGSALED